MQRVTDREVASIYAIDREVARRKKEDAAYEAYLDAQERKEEDARMALFIKRRIAGLPTNRATDRICEAALMAMATEETQGLLQGLLTRKNEQ